MKLGAPVRAVYKTCIICRKDFYCIQSRIKTAKTCSRKCFSAYNSGPNNPKWTNGTKNWAGYRLICINGKQVREHRHIMQLHLGRKLLKTEEVHHLNGNKLDNRIENLYIATKSDHAKIHNQQRERDGLGRFQKGYTL